MNFLFCVCLEINQCFGGSIITVTVANDKYTHRVFPNYHIDDPIEYEDK